MLAYFIGYQYYLYLRRHTVDKLSQDQRLLILVAGIAGALIGSRLLAVFENYSLFQQAKNPWLFLLSNKTILGGFLGGLITIEIGKWIFKIRASSGDNYLARVIQLKQHLVNYTVYCAACSKLLPKI